MRTIFLLCVIALFAPLPTTVSAQFGVDATSGGFRMVVTPPHPGANTIMTARIIDQLRLEPIARIEWTIDGEVREEFTDQQTIQFVTGAVGDTANLTATVQLLSGEQFQFTESLTATRLDLIVEADTITPALYTGRALPALGSTLRITAFPFTSDEATDPATYTYRWRVNDQPVTGQQRSANQVIIPTNFERRVDVEVEVIRPDNTILTTGSTSIEPVEPEIVFYEIHPLRGILPLALLEQHILTKSEMLLRAEPYHMSNSLLTGEPRVAWKINRQTVTNQNPDPFEIVLRRQNDTGSFLLETEIRNPDRLLQSADTELRVQF
jgi:hypothetical protein